MSSVPAVLKNKMPQLAFIIESKARVWVRQKDIESAAKRGKS